MFFRRTQLPALAVAMIVFSASSNPSSDPIAHALYGWRIFAAKSSTLEEASYLGVEHKMIGSLALLSFCTNTLGCDSPHLSLPKTCSIHQCCSECCLSSAKSN